MNNPNATPGSNPAVNNSTVNSSTDQVQGEGDYKAAERYNESARSFVDSGKAARASRNAAPASNEEAKELEAAEKAGLARSKGEDPASPRSPHRKP